MQNHIANNFPYNDHTHYQASLAPQPHMQDEFRIEITGTTLESNHTEYLIKVTSNNYPTFTIKKRYREIRELHESMKQLYPNQLFPFPGKRFFANYNSHFIEQRKHNLEFYLQRLLEIDASAKSAVLRQFLRIDKQLSSGPDSKNLGSESFIDDHQELRQNYDGEIPFGGFSSHEEYVERRSIDTILNTAKMQMIDLALPLNFAFNPINIEHQIQHYQVLLNRIQDNPKPPIVLPNEDIYFKWPAKYEHSPPSSPSPVSTTSCRNHVPTKSTGSSLFNSLFKRFNDSSPASDNTADKTPATKNATTPIVDTFKQPKTNLLTTPLDPSVFTLSKIHVVPPVTPPHILSVIESLSSSNSPVIFPIPKNQFMSYLNQLAETQKESNHFYSVYVSRSQHFT